MIETIYKEGDKLVSIKRKITQDLINCYANVSGDHNPIHINKEYAKSTEFGARIAHGMLNLGIVSEMLQESFQEDWRFEGQIKTKFTAPVYSGEVISTYGTIISVQPSTLIPSITEIQCSIGCKKENGSIVIEGSALLKIRA